MLGIFFAIAVSGNQLALSDKGAQSPWTPSSVCDVMANDSAVEDERVVFACSDALQVDPTDHTSLIARARAYFRQGKIDEAIADLTADLKANPSALGYRLRGLCLRWEEKYQLALADLNAAVSLNPNDSFALGERGTVYDKLGDHDRAIADLTRSLEINAEDPYMFADRGFAYLHAKRYADALADFSSAIDKLRTRSGTTKALKPVLIARCFAYRHAQMFAKAVADCSEAAQLDPQDAEAYLSRGMAERYQGNFSAAIADEDEAIRLDSKFAPAYEYRALAYSDVGKYELALSDLATAIQLSPN